MAAGDRLLDGDTPQKLEVLRRRFALALHESDRRGARRLMQRAVAAGLGRTQIMAEVIGPAVEEVGQDWVEHGMSLSQIFVTGLIVKDAMELLPPDAGAAVTGTVVVGTPPGDYHGLGKLIVSTFLRSAGFVVMDLGLSVSPKTFVDAAIAHEADIIAVSALMADSALKIRDVRVEMKKRKQGNVRLLVGGASFRYNPELYKVVGADATAPTAYEGIDAARRLLENRK